MNAGVGDGAFPLDEEVVLFLQAGKRPSLESVALDVTDLALGLALVPRHVGPGRQQDGSVMFAEGPQFGVDLRVVPVGLGHGRFEIVDHQRFGDAAEVLEGVLQAT